MKRQLGLVALTLFAIGLGGCAGTINDAGSPNDAVTTVALNDVALAVLLPDESSAATIIGEGWSRNGGPVLADTAPMGFINETNETWADKFVSAECIAADLAVTAAALLATESATVTFSPTSGEQAHWTLSRFAATEDADDYMTQRATTYPECEFAAVSENAPFADPSTTSVEGAVAFHAAKTALTDEYWTVVGGFENLVYSVTSPVSQHDADNMTQLQIERLSNPGAIAAAPEPADPTGGSEIASALNPALDCDAIGGLIAPMTDGLFLTDFSYVEEAEIGCVWTSTAGASAFDGSQLDVGAFVWQDDSYGPPDALAAQCETTRIMASGLDSFGGCIYEDVSGDYTFDALMPYFKIRLTYSCEGSTTCVPVPPANAEELVINAMSSLGAALAAG